MLRNIYSNGSLWSGILIGLAGWIFVSVGGGLLGSILFAIGLLCVVLFGSFLYTGKAGSWNFRPFTFRQDVWGLVKVLLGNVIGCGVIGIVANFSGTLDGNEVLSGIIQSRESHDAFQTIARGIGCGILMELAVWSYREKGTVLEFYSVFPLSLCLVSIILWLMHSTISPLIGNWGYGHYGFTLSL